MPYPVTPNPLLAQLCHRPFPEVAAALRLVADRIVHAWDVAVRQAMPQMRHLTFDELKDSTPQILEAIAGAMASDDPNVISELIRQAPSQGLSRLALHLDLIDVMQEDRLLRAITIELVEEGLGRQMDRIESAAMHAAIDIMLQRSVIALVDQQKTLLRAAAETELKFLSFLSHDLNNNLGSVTLWLDLMARHLKTSGSSAEAEEILQHARRSISNTVTGMRRMLDHARLRQPMAHPVRSPVDLHSLVSRIIQQVAPEAGARHIGLSVAVQPGTVVESDEQMLCLVVQNVVGNAVKFSRHGTVQVGCDHAGETGERTIWISDEGPGIPPDMLGKIFEAFRRGDVHGQPGMGLGLAIASQAAKLLDATLTVDSQLGVGSTFRLCLPATNLQVGNEPRPRTPKPSSRESVH